MLVSLHCSGTGKGSQRHGGVRKPSSACSPCSHRFGQGTGAQLLTVPCHRNALPASICIGQSGALEKNCCFSPLLLLPFRYSLTGWNSTEEPLRVCLGKVAEVADSGETPVSYRRGTEQHILGPASSRRFLLWMKISPVFLEASS